MLSGVLQGCPLSGSLFVIAIDPLLHQFHKHLCAPALATVRVCADDVGAAVRQLRTLFKVWELFEAFRKVSLLTLKPKKCIIVPLTVATSGWNCGLISEWLSVNIPEWAHFNIVPSAKYLGIYLGPKAGAHQWVAPVSKFKVRVGEIHAQNLPAGISAVQYMSKAVSVLGYVGQIASPPKRFKSVELASVLKVLGFMTNSLTTEAAFNLDFWGWSKISRPSVYMHACMARAASKTIINYEVMHKHLAKIALEALPANQAVSGICTPPGWDSNAFCTNLVNMSRGKLCFLSPSQSSTLSRMIKDFRKGGIKTKRCQTHVFKFLQSCAPNPWISFLPGKIANILPNLIPSQREVYHGLFSPCAAHPSGDQWSSRSAFIADLQKSILRISKCCGKGIILSILKTWANSWATTSRMHEDVRWPCILGCPGEIDDLSHYLVCDRFWSGILAGVSAPASLIQVDPLIKICIINPSALWAGLCAIGFKTYHAIRRDHRAEVHAAIFNGDWTHLANLIGELAAYFCDECKATKNEIEMLDKQGHLFELIAASDLLP